MAWQADYSHTHIMFSARHMMISTVRGQFDKFSIDAEIDEHDVANSKIAVKIDAASVNTRFAQRDDHLRSSDFFNVVEHPDITFISKRGVHLDDRHGKLIGDLTIRGVTREVTLDVEFLGRVKSPWGAESAGFSAKTKLSRKEWQLNWNVALESGGWLVGDDVTLDIEAELVNKPEPAKVEPKPEAVKA